MRQSDGASNDQNEWQEHPFAANDYTIGLFMGLMKRHHVRADNRIFFYWTVIR